MRVALIAAKKGRGRVHPNPLVGAVVASGTKILSAGAHEVFGGPHAEANALRRLRRLPANATLYTTLEPCTHFGKTPPCVDLILRKKIRRVVIASKDPNPLVSGRGIRRLQKAGIHTVIGVLSEESDRMNEDFFHWIRTGRPFVTGKIAESRDGRITTGSPRARWITGKAARLDGHRLRSRCDAILIGAGTVLQDDPLLTFTGCLPR